jgi:hypothetical protein
MLACLLLILMLGSLTLSEAIDYTNQNGWGGVCVTGQKQSPINITTSDAGVCGSNKFVITLWDGLTTVTPNTT